MGREPSSIKLAILTPTYYGGVYISYAQALARILNTLSLAGISVEQHIDLGRAGGIGYARNKLVKTALARGATHILFWDDDIVPCNRNYELLADAPLLMIGLHYPVVSCLYPSKKGEWCAYIRRENWYAIDRLPPGRYMIVDGVGMGFCLIESFVFEEVEYPWFEWCEEDGRILSEDLYFCEKLNRAGFKILIDTEIRARHIMQFADLLSPQDVRWRAI